MLSPEELREKLKDRVIKVVAEKSGLHYNTVANIANGKSPDPSYASIKILSEYFEE